MRFFLAPALAVFLSKALLAQSTIVGAGYASPVPLNAAPGQVLTLFVQGVNQLVTPPVRATDPVWPATLDGFTVTLIQGTKIPVPILEVRPTPACGQPFPLEIPCGTITAITVQIPYELIPVCPLCLRPVGPSPELIVSKDGQDGLATAITPFSDQVHVLTSCDILLQSGPPAINYTGLPCAPMVIHGDGQLVSASNPAKQGEELAAYAVGLGATNPAARDGQPAAAPLRTVQSFLVDFNFRANALPAKPAPDSPTPVFTGLTPKYTGLYQINFVVPSVPDGTRACAGQGTFAPGANAVQSNLTVSFGGAFSFDGAGICVSPAH